MTTYEQADRAGSAVDCAALRHWICDVAFQDSESVANTQHWNALQSNE
jgi:hypothetical protein